jgi:hypothetical protein
VLFSQTSWRLFLFLMWINPVQGHLWCLKVGWCADPLSWKQMLYIFVCRHKTKQNKTSSMECCWCRARVKSIFLKLIFHVQHFNFSTKIKKLALMSLQIVIENFLLPYSPYMSPIVPSHRKTHPSKKIFLQRDAFCATIRNKWMQFSSSICVGYEMRAKKEKRIFREMV